MPKNLRQIRSYVRREGRTTPAQKKALESLLPKYGSSRLLSDIQCPCSSIDFAQIFKRRAKIVLEIGFGMGDSLISMARENPEINFIGIDVYAPGVGTTLKRIAEHQLNNVYIFHADAVDVLECCILPESLSRIHIYFPDPWPKKRHHKRRLIQRKFIDLLLQKLEKGGILHVATDDDDYAENIGEVLEATSGLTAQGKGDNSLIRPETKFEQRAKKMGHQIHEYIFARGF